MNQFELIGVRATAGPLEFTALPLHPGLNVLYGLNGSGKTAVLRSIQSGLAGMPVQGGRELNWQVSLLVRVPDNDSRYTVSDAFRMLRGRRSHAEARAHSAYLEAAETRKYGPPAQLDLDPADVASEVVGQRLVVVSPIGATEPAWRVLVASDRDAGPHVQRVFDAEAVFSRAFGDYQKSDPHPIAMLSGLPVERFIEEGWDSEVENEEVKAEWTRQVTHAVFVPQRGMPEGNIGIFGLLGEEGVLADDGVPWQVAELDVHWEDDTYGIPPIVGLVEDDALAEMDHATRMALSARLTVRSGENSRPATNDELEEWAHELSDRASDYFGLLLLDAPRLRLNFGWPEAWVKGEAPNWTDEHRIPIDRFSRAEIRWASLAVRLALRTSSGRRTVILLDEPEAALHRTAEAHLAVGLQRLAADEDMQIVVATHSPDLLNAKGASVSRVHRTWRPSQDGVARRGETRITPVTKSDVEDLATMGLNPSDLLRAHRVFLLVEGLHEELIFEEVLGVRLRDARAHVLPIRGVTELAATIDSRFLFDFTDAQMVAVVDNMRADRLRDTWEKATYVAVSQGVDPAVKLLEEALPSREGVETKYMQAFLSRAVEKGTATTSRITPFSFAKPDITDYLPLDALLPEVRNATWESLREEFGHQQKYKNFKKWIEVVHGKRLGREVFSREAIRNAAKLMDIPDEFLLFADLVDRESKHRA